MMFTEVTKRGVTYLTAPNISALHAFTTRSGGVSEGAFESLNLGENRGDEPERVCENYRRVKAALGIEGGLVFSKQVHKTDVRVASDDDRREAYEPLGYEADALVTDRPGLPLIIFTADCVPVLLHDPVRGAAGAFHAGWRGTVGDIAGKTVAKMAAEFGCRPENIRAAIGPSIGPCCFETDGDVPEAVERLLGHADFIEKREDGKYTVDLWATVRETLIRAGVPRENIETAGICTRCNHDKFWSHRYTGGVRGSQSAIIML